MTTITRALAAVLQRLFPQQCGNGHWWDPAVCYAKALCGRRHVSTVTLDHNGEIFEMACCDEHTKPRTTWTNVTLNPPVTTGTWLEVERHADIQAARVQMRRTPA